MATIYVGDIGVKLILNVTATISSSSVRKIYYKKPVSGDTGYWSATEESSTSISYTTGSGDIDESGTWKLQAYVEKGTWKLYGTEADLTVNASLA